MDTLRSLGNDMARIFSQPADQVSFTVENEFEEGLSECQICGGIFDGDGDACEICVEEGRAAYMREHDSGAER